MTASRERFWPRRFFLAGWAVLLACRLSALDQPRSLAQRVHTVWGTDQGLPIMVLRAIAQTSDGFLWIGTDEGLIRFDGASFRIYDRSTHDGWKSQRITALCPGHGAYLWIGTQDGLTQFDGSRFTTLSQAGGLPSPYIYALMGGPDGSLWAGTAHGLVQIKQRQMQAFHTDWKLGPAIQALAMDGQGKLWAGTNSGLFISEGDQLKRFPLPGIDLPPNVRTLYWSKAEEVMWVGTTNGLFRLKGDSAERVPVLNGRQSDNILSLAEEEDGSLLIGTQYGGLARRRAGRGEYLAEIYTTQNGLSNMIVEGLLTDREGNIWAATSFGLNRFSSGKLLNWNSGQGLNGDKPYVVLEDRRHILWIGTTKGLSSFQGGVFKSWPLPKRNRNIAQATWNKLTKLNGTGGTTFLPNSICTLCQTHDGALLIGLKYGGIVRLDEKGMRSFGRSDGLTDDEVTTLYEDRAGDLWVGTKHALSRFRKGIISPSNRWIALKDHIFGSSGNRVGDFGSF